MKESKREAAPAGVPEGWRRFLDWARPCVLSACQRRLAGTMEPLSTPARERTARAELSRKTHALARGVLLMSFGSLCGWGLFKLCNSTGSSTILYKAIARAKARGARACLIVRPDMPD